MFSSNTLSHRNQLAILPRKNKKQDKWWGKRQNCAARLTTWQGITVGEGEIMASPRLAKGDTLLSSTTLRGYLVHCSPLRRCMRPLMNWAKSASSWGQISWKGSDVFSFSLHIFLSGPRGMPFVRKLLRNKAVMSASSVAKYKNTNNRLPPSAIPKWHSAKNSDEQLHVTFFRDALKHCVI